MLLTVRTRCNSILKTPENETGDVPRAIGEVASERGRPTSSAFPWKQHSAYSPYLSTAASEVRDRFDQPTIDLCPKNVLGSRHYNVRSKRYKGRCHGRRVKRGNTKLSDPYTKCEPWTPAR